MSVWLRCDHRCSSCGKVPLAMAEITLRRSSWPNGLPDEVERRIRGGICWYRDEATCARHPSSWELLLDDVLPSGMPPP